MAVNRQELRDTIFRGKGTPMYVSGFEASLEGWNPAWAEHFGSLWSGHPRQRAVERLVIRTTASTSDCSRTPVGEAEHPRVVEALAIYFDAVGIKSASESLDEGESR